MISTLRASSSSTRPGPRPTWLAATDERPGASACEPACLMAMENNNLRRRATPHRPRRPVRARWADQPRRLRGLRREGSRPGAEPRRRRRHGQPIEPQGAQSASADRRGGRRPALPSALQSGLQPDRERLCQIESIAPEGCQRTVEGLWKAIGRLIDTFTPPECANYFAAAGYDPT